MKKKANKTMKIAYLAPEIPALSATFVYNEILELEKQGLAVSSISVRKPGAMALDEPAARLAGRTTYLYALPRKVLARNACEMLSSRRGPFLKALGQAVRDALSVGAPSRNSAGILYRFFASSTVARSLIRIGCSHVHAHFAHVPTDIAMYASLISGIPFSFTAHANDIFVRGLLLKEKVQRSAFTVAISKFNRDYLVKKGAERKKIHVLHCGVDPRAFITREPRGVQDPIKIGSLGRMVEKKGFDVLIDACAVLKSMHLPFALEIAGDGPLKDDLTMLAYRKGMGKEVRLIGALPHDRVHDWMKGLDAFVLACRPDSDGDMDGIPVVLMEAMLSGVPVVSTKISGVPELIDHGVTGWLAEAGNSAGLADAICASLRDAGLREVVMARAAARVTAGFDLAKNTTTLATFFQGGSS